jgi:predicted metal-dependent phosphoesterase TrpH
VIIGEEVKSSEGEIIGLFLKELVPRGLSPEDTVRAIHEQGGVATIPHPYDPFRRSVITRAALERIVDSVDAVEGYNCRNIFQRHDDAAQATARRAGKPLTAGTDAHSPIEVGGVYVEMEPFETAAEFLAALPAGRIVGRRSLPLVHWISTYAKVRWRLGLRPTYAAPASAGAPSDR